MKWGTGGHTAPFSFLSTGWPAGGRDGEENGNQNKEHGKKMSNQKKATKGELMNIAMGAMDTLKDAMGEGRGEWLVSLGGREVGLVVDDPDGVVSDVVELMVQDEDDGVPRRFRMRLTVEEC